MTLWKQFLPQVKPYYAVKCNPEHWLLTWLSEGGAGFDCASAREMTMVRESCALAKPDILFANPCKKDWDIRKAAIANVNTTVVDSTEEIEKLKQFGWSGSSLVRIQVEDKGSAMPFSAKFGIEPDNVATMGRFAHMKGQKLNGVSFHVGSGCKEPQQYRLAIQQAVKCLQDLREAGHEGANLIDIGGGFMPDQFEAAASVISVTMKQYPQLRFVAEPGRFMAAQSHDLFVRVIGKKPTKKRDGWRYTLDESLYGQFSCIPFDHARPKWLRVRAEGEARRKNVKGVLYGRTCDSVDFLAAAEEMEELEVGDWLWYPHMGAYTTVTSTEFNGFPKPHTMVLAAHGKDQLPEPSDFAIGDWPKGVQYASAVKVPDV